MVRTVFMGSDAFSVPILEAILDRAERLGIRVVGVVTAPDRPAGRGRRIRAGPVKNGAETRGVPVQQPGSLRAPEALTAVASLRPELIVVASYGQILPEGLLEIPRHGCLNLHPSLLPRLRGPSPIAGAILEGQTVTGTTLMKMVRRMDAGPILARIETEIGDEETSADLGERLAFLSAELLVSRLPDWLSGRLREVSQDDSLATYTQRITKEDGRIDWTQPAETIARRVRAYNPWPVAHCNWGSRTVRILRAGTRAGRAKPGVVVGIDADRLLMGTGGGLLATAQLQIAGGRPLTPSEFVRGHSALIGSTLT